MSGTASKEPTTRRGFFGRLAASLAGGTLVAASANRQAGAATPVAQDGIQKVVYHLSDADKVNFVLGNIRNHITGKGGPDKVRIVLVVHGPPLMAFVAGKRDPKIEKMTGQAIDNGVELVACGNTMKAQDITLDVLPSGFAVADEGGVVRIADLQQQGYFYIRP